MSMRSVILSIVSILAASFGVSGQANSWEGIIPLVSTRDQVEKILGKPVDRTYFYGSVYKNDKGRFTVRYALKSCDEGWNVPIDTVLAIEIPPPEGQVNKSAKELDLDESRYFISGDDAFFGTWTDPVRGVQLYFRNMNQSLLWIKYIPTQADNARRCDGFPPFAPEAQYYLYEEMLFNNPKAGKDGGMDSLVALGLFNIVYRAKESKGKYKGYVLVYFDDKLPFKTYKKRLDQFRTYAKRMMTREGQEVEIIEGGINYRNKAEFYLLHSDRKPPAPTPSLPSPQFMKSKSRAVSPKK